MCAQCVMGAATAAAGVSGVRAWLGVKRFRWMTPGRMRLATTSLVVMGLIGASVGLSSA